MKIIVTFKDPDGVGDSLREAVEESVMAIDGLSDGERESLVEDRLESVRESLSKWIEYDEYLRVEFDTEAGTARVMPAKVEELDQKATKGPWEELNPGMGWVQTKGNPYGPGPMHVLDIRGWGHLTGVGACHLPPEKATAIQRANGELVILSRTLLPAMAKALQVAEARLRWAAATNGDGKYLPHPDMGYWCAQTLLEIESLLAEAMKEQK